MRIRWLRWSIFGVLVGCGVAATVALLLLRGGPRADAHTSAPGAAQPSSALQVEVVAPRAGEMDRTTSQPGSVQAFESVQLHAGVSGYLKTLNVDIGDRVTRGKELAVVDVPELEKLAQRAAAALDQ